MNKFFLLPVICMISLLLLPLYGETMELETLYSFKNGVTVGVDTGIELSDEQGKFLFYPQSLVLQESKLVMLNRHEPAIISLNLSVTPLKLSITKLQQSADKKFSARFFTDLGLFGEYLVAMETSTATLRKISADGKISEVWIPSTVEGQIIDKFYPLNKEYFLFLDVGAKQLLIRNIADMMKDSPDNTGRTIPFTGSDALISKKGILTLEKVNGTTEACLISLKDSKLKLPLAKWTTDTIVSLDTDDKDCFYFYGEDEKGSFIESVDPSQKPCKRIRTSCQKLVFASKMTRVARFEKENSFIAVIQDENDLKIVRLTLPESTDNEIE